MSNDKKIAFNTDELFGSKEQAVTENEPQEITPPQPMHALVNDGPLKRLIDDNFLQYASYVIRDRAIPDAEDGLKPVQRRIMFSLHENDDGKFTKVANIVGHAMQYHPHGDASIADAIVTMVNRRYLIEGQGNFGNIHTGDRAAASRYIECRLTELARNELFNDELTRFIPNYDGRRKEPVALPAKLPLLLMLGTEGIAVGLSTRILPHNFCELITAQIAILKKEKFKLLPDFQQGGIMDAGEYNKGNGKIKLRAIIEIKTDNRLIIREIPYATTTDSLINSIEEAARKKKIKIKSITDFTAGKIEIEIKYASDQKPEKVIQALYAFTQCETSVSSHMIVIQNNRPVEMDVDSLIRYNTEMLVKLLRRELKATMNNLLEEIHRRTLVQIFVENRIYKWIEECETSEAVQTAVLNGVNQFRDELRRDVTNKDIEMLLGIAIRRISLFDMSKSKRDIEKILAELEKVENNLKALIPYAIRYLQNLLRKYGKEYPRLTKIKTFQEVELRQLTANELTVYHDREKGYIGYDIQGDQLFQCSSLDRVIMVWNDGRYKVMPPPDKLFVDEHLLYCAIMDRNHVFTLVYYDEQITYMKRFTFGGTILNREYFCTPEGAHVLYFSANDPEELYVKYRKAKRQRINQQIFHPKKQAVKGVKARGAQMTVKKIRAISDTKPRNWNKDSDAPRGAVIDFV